ncbi:unnamed protein product [Diatraea saccharalis]|uniref:Uncharacterized protein n=1 Tax=Diatraea saccharalis TaxID=40085 RepID=A0A9N9RCL9_9NEOP|nr:unnamed protein product [Diatraea saccharalis]
MVCVLAVCQRVVSSDHLNVKKGKSEEPLIESISLGGRKSTEEMLMKCAPTPAAALHRKEQHAHCSHSLMAVGVNTERQRVRSPSAAGPSARARTACGGSGPNGSDVPTEHGGARAGSAQLTYRDFADGGLSLTVAAAPPLRTRARMRRYRYPLKSARSLPCE